MNKIILIFFILLVNNLIAQDYNYLIDEKELNDANIVPKYKTPKFLINCPNELINKIETNEDGTIFVTKYEFVGSIGYAIDYNLMFVAKTIDKGKTWHIINDNCRMPIGLKVISKDVVLVYNYYTAENSKGYDDFSILITEDGGKSWFEVIPKNFR